MGMSSLDEALALIARRGGTVRTSEALAAGIHARTLHALRDSGQLEQLARGLFRLAELPPPGDPDLAVIAAAVPKAVLCLLSALAAHELTTQIPHTIRIAIPRTSRYPSLPGTPIKVVRFGEAAFDAGIERYDFDGGTIRIYGPEKTLADCFKFRGKLGLDPFHEGLASYRRRPKASMQRVLEFARIDRVDKAIRPYLQAKP